MYMLCWPLNPSYEHYTVTGIKPNTWIEAKKYPALINTLKTTFSKINKNA